QCGQCSRHWKVLCIIMHDQPPSSLGRITEICRGGSNMPTSSWWKTLIGRLGIHAAAALLLATVSWVGTPSAPAPEVADGELLTATKPTTSEVTTRIKEQTERIRMRRGTGRLITKIVYDFNPNGHEAATPDFGPCLDLANYIRTLHELTTVAYVHNKVSR